MPQSTPETRDDIISGAWDYLSTKTDLIEYLGEIPNDDPQEPTAPFLFQYEPTGRIEGSSSCGIVLSYGGTWNSPNTTNSARFPRLVVELYADIIRDSSGALDSSVDSGEVYRRFNELFRRVDRHLQRNSTDGRLFGSLLTSICQRLNDPVPSPYPGGDGMLYGAAFYGIMLTGSTVY